MIREESGGWKRAIYLSVSKRNRKRRYSRCTLDSFHHRFGIRHISKYDEWHNIY